MSAPFSQIWIRIRVPHCAGTLVVYWEKGGLRSFVLNDRCEVKN